MVLINVLLNSILSTNLRFPHISCSKHDNFLDHRSHSKASIRGQEVCKEDQRECAKTRNCDCGPDCHRLHHFNLASLNFPGWGKVLERGLLWLDSHQNLSDYSFHDVHKYHGQLLHLHSDDKEFPKIPLETSSVSEILLFSNLKRNSIYDWKRYLAEFLFV